MTISFRSQQTTCGPPTASDTVNFELNRARRDEVSEELETLRSGMSSIPFVPKCPEFGIPLTRIALNTCHADSSFLKTLAAFLEWPTLEGLEAFVEKKAELTEMLGDHIADLQAVTREQIVINQAARVAKERRFQEFQRALERMDPAEAEAAYREEQERALRLQREGEARIAELAAEFARARARIREKYANNTQTISERFVR
jgi:hypothetical protein